MPRIIVEYKGFKGPLMTCCHLHPELNYNRIHHQMRRNGKTFEEAIKFYFSLPEHQRHQKKMDKNHFQFTRPGGEVITGTIYKLTKEPGTVIYPTAWSRIRAGKIKPGADITELLTKAPSDDPANCHKQEEVREIDLSPEADRAAFRHAVAVLLEFGAKERGIYREEPA